MPTRSTLARLGVFLVVAFVVLGAAPGIGAAQSNDRAGGVVTVEQDEVVSGDLQAYGGSVVIAGTVDGSVEATAGSVIVTSTGSIAGDLGAAAGSVVVEGTVDGDVDAAAGSLLIRDGARIGGSLSVGAGDVRIDGEVAGDVRAAGDAVRLGPTADVGGNVEYDAETFDRDADATVGGSVTENDDLEVGGAGLPGGFAGGPWGGGGGPSIPGWVFPVWGVVLNAVLGAVVLLVAPGFADRVTALGTTEPAKTGGWGLLTVVGIPIALVVLLISIVGIPLALAGAVLFGLVLWLATVLGALVVGTGLLSLADRRSRWGALALGVVVVGVLGLVPFVGGLGQFVVLVIGLGAFARALGGSGTDGRAPSTGG